MAWLDLVLKNQAWPGHAAHPWEAQLAGSWLLMSRDAHANTYVELSVMELWTAPYYYLGLG